MAWRVGVVAEAGAACLGGFVDDGKLAPRACPLRRLCLRVRATQGAEGAPGAGGGRGGGGRLEFERQQAEEADPFGLDQFLSEVKGGGRDRGGKGNALDAIGKRGGMSAAGGGASLDDLAGAGAGMGRRMQFTSGKG